MVSFQQLKSTQILDDCQRSLDLLEQVPDGDTVVPHLLDVLSRCLAPGARCVGEVRYRGIPGNAYALRAQEGRTVRAQGLVSQGHAIQGMPLGLLDLPSADSWRAEHCGSRSQPNILRSVDIPWTGWFV